MRLVMAQVDDASGELLGRFARQLEEIGVRNVQILSSLTKKGRPGHVLLIDLAAELEDRVAVALASELGVGGYRLLRADHRHCDVRTETKTLAVSLGNDVHRFEVRTKRVLRDGRLLHVKAEHDDLDRICATLREHGHGVAHAALKSRVESALWAQGDDGVGVRLEL